MKLLSYEEFEKTLTDEQKKRSRKLFLKFFGEYLDKKPILCGPEGRAAAKGPEALAEYYKDGEKYMKKVSLDDWD